MVVLPVGLEMLGEVVDAFRQDRDLNLGRAGIAGFVGIRLDDFRFAFRGNRHRQTLSWLRAGTGSQSGQVEHALGDEFAIANFGKRQKPACHRDIDCAATIGRIPSAQQNGLAPMEPCRISPCDGQCRDVVQRGLNGQKRVGEAALARRGSIA